MAARVELFRMQATSKEHGLANWSTLMAMSRPFSLEERVYSQVMDTDALGLIVDMDDTLFWEHEFIGPFVDHMASLLEVKLGSNLADDFKIFYLDNWTGGKRRDLFQRSIKELELTDFEPHDFLREMKSLRVPSGLQVRSWAERVFDHPSIPIAILTNGNPEVQKNKFNQLIPQSIATRARLVCAKEISSKPSSLAVEEILGSWKLGPGDVVFVGDSEIDEQCARNSGCRFVRSI